VTERHKVSPVEHESVPGAGAGTHCVPRREVGRNIAPPPQPTPRLAEGGADRVWPVPSSRATPLSHPASLR